MNTFSVAETAAAYSLIRLAVDEDVGETGDITSLATIPASQVARASFVVRTPGTVAGLPLLPMVAAAFSERLVVVLMTIDGTVCPRGTKVAVVSGPLQALLTAERTALNFLQRLSGVAGLTRAYVEAVAGLPVRILDTRKTTPGWRLLEKYAVRQGGGTNHRIGLYDAILIKDNHVAGFGTGPGAVARAVAAVRKHPSAAGLPIELEVDTLEQLDVALTLRPAIVLLDNMSNDQLREAVVRRNSGARGVELEASGGVNLATVRGIAETGVDRISVGALTHSAPALDIGLDFEEFV